MIICSLWIARGFRLCSCIFFDSLDHLSIVDRIESWVYDRGLKEQRLESGKEIIQKENSWPVVVITYSELLMENVKHDQKNSKQNKKDRFFIAFQ